MISSLAKVKSSSDKNVLRQNILRVEHNRAKINGATSNAPSA